MLKTGLAIVLVLGLLLAGCISGSQNSYATPSASANAIQEIPEEELAFPTLDEGTGFENATIGP